MILNTTNLERYGWLFSPSLGWMVREHELGNGHWDVELDSYTQYGDAWEPNNTYFNSATTLTDLMKEEPSLSRVKDWIHGDKVNML